METVATFLKVQGPICEGVLRLAANRVVEAETIIGSMAGWDVGDVRRFCKTAGWRCDEVSSAALKGPTRTALAR